jgi:hypothetical protein
LKGQAEIERFMGGKMNNDRATNINYFEILWKQPDGKVMRTYRSRDAEGKVSEIITEAL